MEDFYDPTSDIFGNEPVLSALNAYLVILQFVLVLMRIY